MTMAMKKPAGKQKRPVGPHPLTLAAERRETRAQEAKESPAFERAEKRLGIEGRYQGKRGASKSKGKY